MFDLLLGVRCELPLQTSLRIFILGPLFKSQFLAFADRLNRNFSALVAQVRD